MEYFFERVLLAILIILAITFCIAIIVLIIGILWALI